MIPEATPEQDASVDLARRKKRTARQMVGVALVMGALAWASVPFYNWFCSVTGFGGTPLVADQAPDEVLDQTITVRFDASLERGMPWEFRPEVRQMTAKIGEPMLAFYEAYNPTDSAVAGSASFNVAPYEAGGFFTKIDCFCFELQVLQPGERVRMPVTFFVDPAIVDDRDAKFVKHITLSYTFHVTEMPEEQAALVLPSGADDS
jgi:cytochrome c oxidase assembly protein subunit 11